MLSHKLTSTSLVKLASIMLRPEATRLDRARWKDVREGRFTVKASYSLARGWVEENRWEGWWMVLKMKV